MKAPGSQEGQTIKVATTAQERRSRLRLSRRMSATLQSDNPGLSLLRPLSFLRQLLPFPNVSTHFCHLFSLVISLEGYVSCFSVTMTTIMSPRLFSWMSLIVFFFRLSLCCLMSFPGASVTSELPLSFDPLWGPTVLAFAGFRSK